MSARVSVALMACSESVWAFGVWDIGITAIGSTEGGVEGGEPSAAFRR